MPGPVRTGSQIDVASLIESILERADLADEAKAEIGALAKEWRWLLGCRVKAIQTSADLTRIWVLTELDGIRGFPDGATFHFPPNDPKFEAELKRLHAEEKSFEIMFYQGRLDADTEITSIYVSSVY